jgi:hypothetical protein
MKTFKKTFTTFNCLILKWKSTTNVIIMRNIFETNVAAYTFWTLFTFCRSSRITIWALYLKRKSFESKFINEYSFQWYQFIIVSFIDDFSRFFRLNNVVFHLRSFQNVFNMRMSQHSFLMKKRFRQIIDVKFKRRCRFYFEFWRFRIEDDHHCCMKYENFRHFFVNSSRVRKIFRRFSNSFFLNDVNNIYSKIDIFRCQHVQ